MVVTLTLWHIRLTPSYHTINVVECVHIFHNLNKVNTKQSISKQNWFHYIFYHYDGTCVLILTFGVPNSNWYDCRRMEKFLKKSVQLILHKSPKDQFETLELYSQVSGKIETCIKGYQRRQLENEENKLCNRYVL